MVSHNNENGWTKVRAHYRPQPPGGNAATQNTPTWNALKGGWLSSALTTPTTALPALPTPATAHIAQQNPASVHHAQKASLSWAEVAAGTAKRLEQAQLSPAQPAVKETHDEANTPAAVFPIADSPPANGAVSTGRTSGNNNPLEEKPSTGLPNVNNMTDRERLVWALQHDALLVAIDAEWYMDRAPHLPTHIKPTAAHEFGVALSDPSTLHPSERLDITTRIDSSKGRHIRIQRLSHLYNPMRKFWHVCRKGCENCFLFGKSEFASEAVFAEMLREMTKVHLDPAKPELGYRAVAFLFFDAAGDVDALAKFGIQLSSAEFEHAFVVDVQKVASPRRKLSLDSLLSRQGVSTDHRHNGGNDAYRTLVAALVLGLGEVESQRALAEAASLLADKPSDYLAAAKDMCGQETTLVSQAVEHVRKRCKDVHQFPNAVNKGFLTFCSRCHSIRHFGKDCRAGVQCALCLDRSHMAEVCPRMHVHWCIEEVTGSCAPECRRKGDMF